MADYYKCLSAPAFTKFFNFTVITFAIFLGNETPQWAILCWVPPHMAQLAKQGPGGPHALGRWQGWPKTLGHALGVG